MFLFDVDIDAHGIILFRRQLKNTFLKSPIVATVPQTTDPTTCLRLVLLSQLETV